MMYWGGKYSSGVEIESMHYYLAIEMRDLLKMVSGCSNG